MTSMAAKPAGGLEEIPDVRRPVLPTYRPLRILLVKPDISDVSVGFATLARVPPLERDGSGGRAAARGSGLRRAA